MYICLPPKTNFVLLFAVLCEGTEELSDFCTVLASILKITTKLFYSFAANISRE